MRKGELSPVRVDTNAEFARMREKAKAEVQVSNNSNDSILNVYCAVSFEFDFNLFPESNNNHPIIIRVTCCWWAC